MAVGLAAVLLGSAACDGAETTSTTVEDDGSAGLPPIDVRRSSLGGRGRPPVDAEQPAFVEAQVLRDRMRELWIEHAFWTRSVVVSATAAQPDSAAALARLRATQGDLGALFALFYGDARADELIVLLDGYVGAMESTVAAATNGDAQALEESLTSWYGEAEAVAAALAKLGPRWAVGDLDLALRNQVEGTVAELTARIEGDWQGDRLAFDGLVLQGRELADLLSNGLAAQFPDRVIPLLLPADPFHQRMREVWEEQSIWARLHLVSRLAGLEDANLAEKRLLESERAIAAVFSDVYGPEVGDDLGALLTEHVARTTAVIEAAKVGKGAPAEKERTAWYANAEEIAARLAELNAYWSPVKLEGMLRTYLQLTRNELEARMGGDWSGDVEQVDLADDHMRRFADLLSVGIQAQHAPKQ